MEVDISIDFESFQIVRIASLSVGREAISIRENLIAELFIDKRQVKPATLWKSLGPVQNILHLVLCSTCALLGIRQFPKFNYAPTIFVQFTIR